MKNLILCCLALVTLGSLAACSDSDKPATTPAPAPMQPDSKDMKK